MRLKLFILLIICSILIFFFITREYQLKEEEKLFYLNKSEQEEVNKHIKFDATNLNLFDKLGNLICSLNSKDLEIKDKNLVILNEVRGKFYEDKKVTLEFKCNKANFFKDKKDILFEDFEGNSINYNMSLSTANLEYISPENELITNTPSKLNFKNMEINSAKLKAKLDEKKVSLQKTKTYIDKNIRIEADEQIFDIKKERLKAFGNVKVTVDNINLYCEEIDYDKNKNKLELKKKVRILKENFELKCATASFDLNKNEVEVKEEFELKYDDRELYGRLLSINLDTDIIEIKKGVELLTKDFNLKSKYILFENKKQYFIAKQNPCIILKKDENITEVKATTIEATLSNENKMILAKDNANIKRQDITASAKQIIIHPDEDKAELINDAYLIQKNNEIRGDKIIFNFKEEKVKVIGSSKVIIEKK